MAIVSVEKLSGKALSWAIKEADIKRRQELGESIKQWVLDEHKAGMVPNDLTIDGLLCHEIETREKISTLYWPEPSEDNHHWWATVGDSRDEETTGYSGETKAIAVFRTFAQCMLGEEIDIPDAAMEENRDMIAGLASVMKCN